jgi:hypothetical protein
MPAIVNVCCDAAPDSVPFKIVQSGIIALGAGDDAGSKFWIRVTIVYSG